MSILEARAQSNIIIILYHFARAHSVESFVKFIEWSRRRRVCNESTYISYGFNKEINKLFHGLDLISPDNSMMRITIIERKGGRVFRWDGIFRGQRYDEWNLLWTCHAARQVGRHHITMRDLSSMWKGSLDKVVKLILRGWAGRLEAVKGNWSNDRTSLLSWYGRTNQSRKNSRYCYQYAPMPAMRWGIRVSNLENILTVELTLRRHTFLDICHMVETISRSVLTSRRQIYLGK